MKLLSNILIWIFAVLLTASVLIYQRMTGPTYPKRGNIEIGSEKISYALLRTWENEKYAADRQGARISLEVPQGIDGEIRYKRLGTNDEWTILEMQREGEEVYAMLPNQPAAGKLLYIVTLSDGMKLYKLTEEPVTIRFKDHIPDWIPLPHVLLIFVALLFSTMTAVEALRRGRKVMTYTLLTLLSMLIGGLIMGPIMQKYAFGAYWTGWPFGQDLTDNKTLVAFIVWLIAFFVLRKNPRNRFWPVFAAVITLAVFVIPHSVLGSEFDYSAGEVVTGR
ncbi:MAG: hypothetical protein V2I47_10095 [Bacteroidales bacterium]|jgi:hypothetical protein|nr:hypothetical protein [Bacteroidales bacterium]